MRGREVSLILILGSMLLPLVPAAPALAQRAPRREAPAPPRALRVVTFNMLHGGPESGLRGSGQELEARLALARDGLRALDPDVVALQEASVSRGRGSVVERLSRELGMHQVHAPATDRFANPFRLIGRLVITLLGFAEGPAILSRFPVVSSEVHDLPRCVKWIDPRVALRADLSTPWGTVEVLSVHASRDDCQVRRVGELLRARPDGRPAVVMGDFNASETSEAITRLTEEAGLVDAFRTANPRAPGLTVWQRIHVPEPTVFRRVDYIFLRPGTELTWRVRSSKVVLDKPQVLGGERALWPSDHYGVLAELELVSSKSSAPRR